MRPRAEKDKTPRNERGHQEPRGFKAVIIHKNEKSNTLIKSKIHARPEMHCGNHEVQERKRAKC